MDHVMDFIYDNNGAPYAMKYDGTEYYYVLNLQGDVIRIIDTTGAAVAEYIYDAWGRPVSATGTMAEVNPIRYRGYYFDSDSGLYYLQSRYYDPEIKRFINADAYASTGQGFLGCNMYAYCLNNPSSYADASGRDAIYVTDYSFETGLPGLGHAVVFIQDSDGTWYLTEFAKHESDTNTEITVLCREARDDEIAPYLNGDVSSLSAASVYLEGDYTNSLALAQSYSGTNYGGYKLCTNNCLNYALEILRAGTCNNQCVQKCIQSSKGGVPSQFGRKLKTASIMGKLSRTIGKSKVSSLCKSLKKSSKGFIRQLK